MVDLRLGDGNGLDVVSALKRKRPDARAIVLTGYGNIATAVTAVKMGAVDYLSKPADADDVVAALLASGTERPNCRKTRCLPTAVRWEHIQRIYEMCNRNVSETARRLNMHRRTLQRILARNSPDAGLNAAIHLRVKRARPPPQRHPPRKRRVGSISGVSQYLPLAMTACGIHNFAKPADADRSGAAKCPADLAQSCAA